MRKNDANVTHPQKRLMGNEERRRKTDTKYRQTSNREAQKERQVETDSVK